MNILRYSTFSERQTQKLVIIAQWERYGRYVGERKWEDRHGALTLTDQVLIKLLRRSGLRLEVKIRVFQARRGVQNGKTKKVQWVV